MPIPLHREFQFYLDHQDELVREYNGKYLVIVDNKVEGAYDTQEVAVTKALESFDRGTFLVQKCAPGSESYTRSFHSRIRLVAS